MIEATILYTSTKHFNPFTWLIKKFQKFPASHAMIMVEDNFSEESICYEASALGIRAVNFDHVKKTHTIEFKQKVKITPLALSFYQKHLLTGYSYKAILGFALRQIFHLKRNAFDDNERKMVCSEYVARGLRIAGYKFDNDLDDLDVGQLYRQVQRAII